MSPRRFLVVAGCLVVVASFTMPGVLGPESGRDGDRSTGDVELAFAADAAAVGSERNDRIDDGGPPLPAELRLALARPSSLDPAVVSLADQSAVIVADLLFDGLTQVAADGDTLEPALAARWSADGDLRKWTFELDPDREVDAGLVADHFRDLLAQPPSPAVAWLLTDVVDVAAIGDRTVEFELRRPNAGFAWLVSGLALSVPGEDGAPTGWFAIAEDEPGHQVLVWQGEPDATPVERIRIRWTETAEDAYRLLTLGLVDGAVAPPELVGDARARFGSAPGARGITRFYGMSRMSSTLADQRLRLAVLSAVDRERIAAEVSRAPAMVVDGIVSPGTAGFRSRACGLACRFDRATAAALVAEVRAERSAAGGDAAMTLRIAYGAEDQRLIARSLADDLEAVGFQTVLLPQTPDGLAGAVERAEADLFAFGWVAPAGSVDAVIPALLGDSAAVDGLGPDAPLIDQLVERASLTADDEARWWLLQRAHALALADSRVLPLTAATSFLVTAPQAEGLVSRADGSIAIVSG